MRFGRLRGLLLLVAVAALVDGGALRGGSPRRAEAVCATIGYAAAVNYAVQDQPTDVATADFNEDGRPDLAVANAGGSSVSVLLGTGSGAFGAATNLAMGGSARRVAAVDMNGDANTDLVVSVANLNRVAVLLGDGAGGFGAATNYGVASGPNAMTTGDFDGDGDVDVAVAVDTPFQVAVMLGDGTGALGGPTGYALASLASNVLAGDFNGDGDLDLAVTVSGTDNVAILLGGAGATFGAAAYVAVGDDPQDLAAGDVNGDGDLDLAVVDGVTAATTTDAQITVLLGDGAGGFAAAAGSPYALLATSLGVALADLDLDGDLDVAASNRQASDRVSVRAGDGAGAFAAATSFAVGDDPRRLVLADLDADGQRDVAVVNQSADTVSVFLSSCNDSPVVATNAGLTLQQGATGSITTARLRVTDPDHTAAQLTYTLTTAPTRGTLRLSGGALAAGGTFTQANIDGGLLDYVNSGVSAVADSFTFTVADAGGATLGATTCAITVGAPTVSLSVNDAGIPEAGGTAVITATLSATTGVDVTVTLALSGTAGSADYGISGTTIVIAAGSTIGTRTLTAVQDGDDEPNETVVIDVAAVTNATASGTLQVTVTINDDDDPPAVPATATPVSTATPVPVATTPHGLLPDGVATVVVSPLTVLPPGIAPVTGNGVVVSVPPRPAGAVGVVATGGDPPVTFGIPAGGGGPDPIGVRLQPVDVLPGGAQVPAGRILTLAVQVDVFNLTTGALVHHHEPPLLVAFVVPESARANCAEHPERIVLMHVSDAGAITRLPPSSLDCTTGILLARLFDTSVVAVAETPSGLTIPYRSRLLLLGRPAD